MHWSRHVITTAGSTEKISIEHNRGPDALYVAKEEDSSISVGSVN
jgi:hypothetical protein